MKTFTVLLLFAVFADSLAESKVVEAALGTLNILPQAEGLDMVTTESVRGAVLPKLSPKGESLFNQAKRELTNSSLDNLKFLIKEQAIQSDYTNAEQAIVNAKEALEAYESDRSKQLLDAFYEAAKSVEGHVRVLFDGLLGRHRIAVNVVEALSDTLHCRSHTIEQRLAELITLARCGVLVDEIYKQMNNSTKSDREPFGGFLQKATDQLKKRLDEKLNGCRQLMSVSSEMKRVLEANANETHQKVLDDVYGFLSDRYDQHDWLVLVFDTRARNNVELDFTFYEVKSGVQHIAALPVLRVPGVSNLKQTRHWIIDRLCPKNRISSEYEVYVLDRMDRRQIQLFLGKDMHFAAFHAGIALWRHSKTMDIAEWPHRSHFCNLGHAHQILLAVAPSYKIPRDPVPTTSMALMNRYGYALTTSERSSEVWPEKFTNQAGQRWKFVNGQLQNDLGRCFYFINGIDLRVYNSDRPCWTDFFLQLDDKRLTSPQYGAFGFQRTEDTTVAWPYVRIENKMFVDHWKNITEWFFSPDGRKPFLDEPPSSANGGPLINGFGLVLSVEDDVPHGVQLFQDLDRNLTGQRWRLEGRHLKNDWNFCLGVVIDSGGLMQRPCNPSLFYNLWVYQDGQIKNERGTCLGVSGNSSARGASVEVQTCSDSNLGQRWTLNGYTAPPQKVVRALSGPLVNGFGLAATVKGNYGDGWQWMLQQPFKGLEGQRWFLDGRRLQNELGFCMRWTHDRSRWVYQDDCTGADAEIWYRFGKQIRSLIFCLGVHENVGTDGAWLVVEWCDASKRGQMWTFASP